MSASDALEKAQQWMLEARDNLESARILLQARKYAGACFFA